MVVQNRCHNCEQNYLELIQIDTDDLAKTGLGDSGKICQILDRNRHKFPILPLSCGNVNKSDRAEILTVNSRICQIFDRADGIQSLIFWYRIFRRALDLRYFGWIFYDSDL